jgi:hypothetical protein
MVGEVGTSIEQSIESAFKILDRGIKSPQGGASERVLGKLELEA